MNKYYRYDKYFQEYADVGAGFALRANPAIVMASEKRRSRLSRTPRGPCLRGL